MHDDFVFLYVKKNEVLRMLQVATAILFDRNNQLLIYLRDDKLEISFPNHWDLFGGHVEEGETPEQALVRELKEELNIEITDYRFFKKYESTNETKLNTKFVFVVHIQQAVDELTLYEGQELRGIDLEQRSRYKFANMLEEILEDFTMR
jgi:8-oxo-dGTP diphosphatase